MMLVLNLEEVMVKELNYKMDMNLVLGTAALSIMEKKVSNMELAWGLVVV